MHTLRPRDFIEADGLIAAVTSVAHPEGPTITPRYVRQEAGLRKLDTVAGHAYVRSRHPGWLVHSPLLGVEVVLVPWDRIEHTHRPEVRARELRAAAAGPLIERRAAGIVSALVAQGVPEGRIGVTGSLLVGAATDASDVDVVVYGRAAFAAARAALAALVTGGGWQPLASADWQDAWTRRGAPGTFASYVRHELRKGTKAMVQGTRLDLSLLQDADEGTPERPPYRKLGPRTVEAVVTDATAAFDLPARYVVRHDEIREVVSWTATYSGQALAGERMRATGWLEEDAHGMRRLLVGTSREAHGEFLSVLDDDA